MLWGHAVSNKDVLNVDDEEVNRLLQLKNRIQLHAFLSTDQNRGIP